MIQVEDIIECSILGTIVNRHTNQPMKFSNDAVMAGLRNKLNQVIRNSETEI